MLPFTLSICGLDELNGFLNTGVTHVISILDPDYPVPDGLAKIASENRIVFRFDDATVPGAGRIHPASTDIGKLVEWSRSLTDSQVKHLLVHCHAGISRSTAAAAIIVADKNPGRETEIFKMIDRIRPRNWPNSMMIDLADQLLGCGGAFNAALQSHHARIATRDPDLAEIIRRHGRAHEIPDDI